jgi:hypothetical protein
MVLHFYRSGRQRLWAGGVAQRSSRSERGDGDGRCGGVCGDPWLGYRGAWIAGEIRQLLWWGGG